MIDYYYNAAHSTAKDDANTGNTDILTTELYHVVHVHYVIPSSDGTHGSGGSRR